MSLFDVSPERSAAAVRSQALSIAAQTVLITAGFFAYLGVRSMANGSEAAAFRHAKSLLSLEARIGIDIEKNLQAAALDVPGLIQFFNFVYAWTYWPFIIGTFVVTWFWKRELFTLYRNAMMISGAIGLVMFTMIPVAPPRFLPGFIDTVGQSARSNFIGHPDGFINEFAALPSFHVGWVALASAVLFLGAERRWLKVLLVVPPTLMAVAVVLTANHYLLDIVAGVGLSFFALALAKRTGSPAARLRSMMRSA